MDTGSILWADVILLAILALFALGGLQRGFVHETLDIVGLALATALALLVYQQVAVAIDRAVGLPPNFVDLVAFSAVFFVGLTVFAIVSSVVAWPIERTLSRLGLHRLNALLGIAPGLLKGLIIVGFGIRALALAPIDGALAGEVTSSQVGRRIADAATITLPYVESAFTQIEEKATAFLPPVSDSPTAAPAGTPSASPQLNIPRGLATSPDPDSEAVMLRLVNQERTLAGLQPLVADDRLRAVARAHSEEMFRLGYFAHDSPVSGSPFDRLRRAGISYVAAGENLAYAPTVEAAHRGLMNSPEHRRNILDLQFRRVGIGVQQSGLWGRMFTQDFTS